MFDFVTNKESQNLIPILLENKEQYYRDLSNIEYGMVGRLDVMFSNQFFDESIQLIINAITLFEKGYFDCAFYSLRQSLEISTTIVYLVDDDEENRKSQLSKWVNEEEFPMDGNMINELTNRKKIFSDIKEKMSSYFEDVKSTKRKLNKYVHKQGFEKFYTYKRSISKDERLSKLSTDFEKYLIKSIGAIAILRLVIDPLPLLLLDENIYNRTEDLLTENYSLEFLEKYIGIQNIESYKKTQLFKDYYNELIEREEMLPAIVNIKKNQFIDNTKFEEIFSQKHLLNQFDSFAVAIAFFFSNVVKIYCHGGFYWYWTNTKSLRNELSFSSSYFDIFKGEKIKLNSNFDNIFLSCVTIIDEQFYFEHNYEFTKEEIELINAIVDANNKINKSQF